MKHLSSRPIEDEDPFVLEDLVPAEMELIAALLYHVQLGNNRMYRTAAFSLMEKIERYVGDEDYIRECAEHVKPTINILDAQGWTVGSATEFEIIV